MELHLKLAEREELTTSERLLEGLIIIALLALLIFFVYQQQTDSGFFTEKFGMVEMVYLYGSIGIGLIAPAIRAFTGRRQPARPFEIGGNIFLAVGMLWLEIAFPFDFARLAATLPDGLHATPAWVVDELGRVPLALAVFFGTITAVISLLRYLAYPAYVLSTTPENVSADQESSA